MDLIHHDSCCPKLLKVRSCILPDAKVTSFKIKIALFNKWKLDCYGTNIQELRICWFFNVFCPQSLVPQSPSCSFSHKHLLAFDVASNDLKRYHTFVLKEFLDKSCWLPLRVNGSLSADELVPFSLDGSFAHPAVRCLIGKLLTQLELHLKRCEGCRNPYRPYILVFRYGH